MGQEREELLRLSTLAGAAGFLTFSIHEKQQQHAGTHHKSMTKRAEILAAEWRNGINALTTTTTTTGETVGACGRFPDKNGIFHWD